MEVDHDPPQMIPQLMDQAISGYDVVIGDVLDSEERSFVENAMAKVFYNLVNKALGFQLKRDASYFRLLSRQVVNSITRIRNKSRFLKYFNAVVGFNQTHVPYKRVYRREIPTPRLGLLRSMLWASDFIISNSPLPLRFVSLLGVLASVANLVYLGYILVVSLFKDNVAEGWLTTSLTSTFMFFILFIILTVLSEYVGRILEETRDRPLYFIEYETNSSVISYKADAAEKKLNVV